MIKCIKSRDIPQTIVKYLLKPLYKKRTKIRLKSAPPPLNIIGAWDPHGNLVIGDAITAFTAFKEVKEACFGQNLDPYFESSIQDFGLAYLQLGIPVTSKVHTVLVHVKQFLNKQNGQGLGVWSEQALESLHHDFNQLRVNGKYKRTLTPAKYSEQLLKCVVTYNSRHV
jgi:hypothetical protein